MAVWVVPNVEHYEYLPPATGGRDAWPRTPHPDVLGYGLRDFGNRVGLWRIAEVTDDLGIPLTLSLNLANWLHYPEIFEASEARGWDVMAHGLYNTRYHWEMPEQAEREAIGQCVEIYRTLTGRMLRGWFSPAATWTKNTPDLVAEAGISYYCDWYHDDQPTQMNVRSGQLITLPYQMDINDAMVWRHHFEADDFAQMVIDHFDTLWREGADHGRVVCIALHPYIMGQPHRIRALERALRHVVSHDKVWMATGAEIADWYLSDQWSEAL
ncbi:polysaccharide deacetylase family protein [uncultured Boseongicola sp.]|uniref:polysaccharide deacetylase family protein n=1 Tax=uncultured Boseongicola sp. TaxID=1648499 RepID=UPI0026121050|nr:polysaccharide deacetylase family protein [uncultured Boseongicola sp.]